MLRMLRKRQLRDDDVRHPLGGDDLLALAHHVQLCCIVEPVQKAAGSSSTIQVPPRPMVLLHLFRPRVVDDVALEGHQHGDLAQPLVHHRGALRHIHQVATLQLAVLDIRGGTGSILPLVL